MSGWLNRYRTQFPIYANDKFIVSLCNRRWTRYRSRYQGFVDTFDFPKVPEGYTTLVPALWFARDIDEIVPLAEQLAGNFWQFLADEGLRLPTSYQTVDDVPL